MNYTLICYKHATYDCCSGITESEHEIHNSLSTETIVDAWANCLEEDEFREIDEAFWEVTLLIDGVEASNDVYNAIKCEAMIQSKAQCKLRREDTERENKAIRRNNAEKQKQEDLAELQRLTTKYG